MSTHDEDCYWWIRVIALVHMFRAHRVEYTVASKEVSELIDYVHNLSGHCLYHEAKGIADRLDKIIVGCGKQTNLPHYSTLVGVRKDAKCI